MAKKSKGKSRANNARARQALTANRETGSAQMTRMSRFMIRETGSQYFDTVVYNDGYVQNRPISWLGLVGSRLQSIMELYEMYFVRKLVFRYVPTVSKTTLGSVVLAFDFDPNDNGPLRESAETFLTSFEHAKTIPMCEESTLVVPNPRTPVGPLKSALYTDVAGDSRLNTFGRLFWKVIGHDAGSATDVAGRIVLEYDIDLYVPQLQYAWLGYNVYDMRLKVIDTATPNTIMSGNIGEEGTGYAQLHFYTGSATPKLAKQGELFTGEVGTGSNITLKDGQGDTIATGTRIFLRVAFSAKDSTAGTWRRCDQDTGESLVGEISTTLDFTPGTILAWAGTLGAYIYINKAIKFVRDL